MYLDYASWMPLSGEAAEEMAKFSSIGDKEEREKTLFAAKEEVANSLHTAVSNIVFTTGGSTANELLFRVMRAYLPQTGRTHIVTSEMEHESVWEPANELVQHGFSISYPVINKRHRVTPIAVRNVLQEDTGLVSIIYADNITGSTNNIDPIFGVCKMHGNILTHTDACCAFYAAKTDVNHIGCDFLSISGHKIGGPDGIGALYVRDVDTFLPIIRQVGGSLLLGDSEESQSKVIGLGTACRHAGRWNSNTNSIVYYIGYIFSERNMGWLKWKQDFFTANDFRCIAVPDVSSKQLSNMLKLNGIELGVCRKDAGYEQRKERVLKAMGFDDDYINRFMRILQPPGMTSGEVYNAARILANSIEYLYFRNQDLKQKGDVI